MTPEQIAELRAIIAAATPGPWFSGDESNNECRGVFYGNQKKAIGYCVDDDASNAKAIAVSVASLPSALDTIEAQQRRIEELEAALIAMRTVMDDGPIPKRLDDALTWRQCDEKARAMCDAALRPKEPS